ncbi:hypothetical protein AVEN_261165-1 [Araneus ventricosus]|uniref:Uncharacterized protein n=1 Tax=Araneus ventricosus TaxID=182803 RepID=A0A4Y2FM01_ARAVE|nr:hypothetical protein AVEN_261165-1 [Araneus ventricosus]
MTERHHGKKMAPVAPPTIGRRRQLIVTAIIGIGVDKNSLGKIFELVILTSRFEETMFLVDCLATGLTILKQDQANRMTVESTPPSKLPHHITGKTFDTKHQIYRTSTRIYIEISVKSSFELSRLDQKPRTYI